jgi:hypothetical protein
VRDVIFQLTNMIKNEWAEKAERGPSNKLLRHIGYPGDFVDYYRQRAKERQEEKEKDRCQVCWNKYGIIRAKDHVHTDAGPMPNILSK